MNHEISTVVDELSLEPECLAWLTHSRAIRAIGGTHWTRPCDPRMNDGYRL